MSSLFSTCGSSMLFQISPCSGRLTESLQASAISHSVSVNAGIISLLGRTLLITSDRSLVGIRVGTHGERYWLQWTNHRMSWGRASLRAACMSGSVKMGEASLGCSLPLAIPESIISDVFLCLSSNRSFLWQQLNVVCSFSSFCRISFLILFFPSSHTDLHRSPDASISSLATDVEESGSNFMWFLLQVQRHFIRGQAAYSNNSESLCHNAPFLRGWVSAIFFLFLNFNNSNFFPFFLIPRGGSVSSFTVSIMPEFPFSFHTFSYLVITLYLLTTLCIKFCQCYRCGVFVSWHQLLTKPRERCHNF